MIFIGAIITVLYYSSITSGVCPAQGNPMQAVVRYQQINTYEIIDPTVRTAVQKYLDNVSIGLCHYYSAVSCKQMAKLRPSYESGYYWIQGASGTVGVYCEMSTNNAFGQSGGWMRIANVDMRNNHSQCPPGLVYNVTEGKRLCYKPSLSGCSSTIFSTKGVRYSKVCGKVIGYQYYRPNGFGPSKYTSPLINGAYVDGVSITHGSP